MSKLSEVYENETGRNPKANFGEAYTPEYMLWLEGHLGISQQVIEMKSVSLETAMDVLRQISTTPRNRGAKRIAQACVNFLEIQLKTPESQPTKPKEAKQ